MDKKARRRSPEKVEREAGKTKQKEAEDRDVQLKKKRRAEKDDDTERSEKKTKTENLAIVATDQPAGIIKKQGGEKLSEDEEEEEEEEIQKRLADAEKNMKVNSTTHRKMWMKFLRFRKNKKKMRQCPAQMVAALQSEARDAVLY